MDRVYLDTVKPMVGRLGSISGRGRGDGSDPDSAANWRRETTTRGARHGKLNGLKDRVRTQPVRSGYGPA
jgi:hypothetical protein